MLRFLFVFALVSLLAACTPHRFPMQQGSVIEPAQYQALHAGMLPEEVRNLLGTPTTIDQGDPERWHYLYLFDSETRHTRHRLTLDFHAKRLHSWQATAPGWPADDLPSRNEEPLS